MIGPDDILDEGRYKGTRLRHVPDSYVREMIRRHTERLQVYESEQTRRALMATIDQHRAIDELLAVVDEQLKRRQWQSNAECQAFRQWVQQQATKVMVVTGGSDGQ